MNLETIFGNNFTNAISKLDWAGNTLVRLIDLLLSMALQGFFVVYNMLFKFVDNLVNINQFTNAKDILNFTADVASSLLIIIFLIHVFTNYVLDLNGEADYDVIQSVTNISIALAVINCAGEIHEILLKVSSLLQEGLSTAMVNSTINSELTFEEAITNAISKMEFVFNGFFQIGTPYGPSLFFLACIWGLIIVILFVVLLVKMLFRSVELLFFRILLPFFAVDLITPQKEYWKQFLQEYLKTIFGYLLQRISLDMSLALMFDMTTISATSEDFLRKPIIATLLLFFAIKTPKWLQKFTYSSGVGQTVSSAGRSVVSTGSSIFMMSRFM